MEVQEVRKRGDRMGTETPVASLEKVLSGIEGFDDITSGGLPQGRTTLLMGGPGCGKTVLALQILVSAARDGRPGIFVAFEENARRVSANGEIFGWDMLELEKRHLFFVDARLRGDVVATGAFDLSGLLAALEAKVQEMGATLIVFDAIDVLLSLLDDPVVECRELYRLNEWLLRHKLTGILTTKIEDNQPATAQRYGFMPFMADCAVLLSQRVEDRVAARAMRVVKFRGSPHVLNEVPFVIGPTGVDIGSSNGVHPEPQPFKERVPTGVAGLDAMLGGGYYRGTNALITGSSGGGKSTLAGAFIEAACRREERALFISFDENSADIVRDLASMSIDLAPHFSSGLLRMESIRTEAASSEEHFMRIKRFIAEQQPRCLAIDPLSALARVGGALAARAIAERLIYLCRNAGITVLFTSLLEGIDPHLEMTTLHVSTIADSWIQISYALLDGERNRALSIVKSRGSKHSNQLRELIFNDTGITLADPYTAGGEVLMGTLRLEKETAVQMAVGRKRQELDEKRREVKQSVAEGNQNMEAAQRDLQNRSEELQTLTGEESASPQSADVRQHNEKLVREQFARSEPDDGKPISEGPAKEEPT